MASLLLHLTDLSSEPLHGQISRQIRARILAQELDDDDPLPSIRGMARQQKVSVITVQRAYDDLEREGLIRSRRGKGFFVAAISPAARQALAEKRLAAGLTRLLGETLAEGLGPQRIRRVFEQVIKQGGGEQR